MPKQIYQIKMALKGSKPNIWRRVLMPSDLPLGDVHQIIQTTMGWDNYHLHQFLKDRNYYTVRAPGETDWDIMDSIDYKKMKLKLSNLLKAEKDKMVYEYDFGDGWAHDIILEKILPVDPKIKYPVCTAGKMNCPPEDCGGIWGYANMLEILKNPEHEEYNEYLEWLGEEFDPAFFDIAEVNELLQEKNYGCFDLSPF